MVADVCNQMFTCIFCFDTALSVHIVFTVVLYILQAEQ